MSFLGILSFQCKIRRDRPTETRRSTCWPSLCHTMFLIYHSCWLCCSLCFARIYTSPTVVIGSFRATITCCSSPRWMWLELTDWLRRLEERQAVAHDTVSRACWHRCQCALLLERLHRFVGRGFHHVASGLWKGSTVVRCNVRYRRTAAEARRLLTLNLISSYSYLKVRYHSGQHRVPNCYLT